MTATRRLPAEWEKQSAVMLTWPHADTDWAWILDDVETVYRRLVQEISRHEKVLIVYRDAAHRQHIENFLGDTRVLQQCVFAQAPSNDSWARDHGPISIEDNGRPQLLDFQFNGWGGKFASELDNAISLELQRKGVFKTPLHTLPLILEGGSIDSDGEGSMLTTENCLLTPTRNPKLNKQQIEELLRKEFGLERILWLKHGHLAGDDTDAHIDTLARFCDPHTIAYCSCDDPQDEHYAELKAMEAELRALRTREGKPYTLVALPIPKAVYSTLDNRRLPATYANFLIINNAVLVPVYNDAKDDIALNNLRRAFPKHEVIAVNCTPIIKQYGSLHCLTMQLVEGVI
jgi:agmatine/peptidylarginine deiminase